MKRFSIFLVLTLLAACQERSQQAVADTRATTPPAVAVDSALSIDTLLRRFQARLAEPTELSHGESSREALTRRYLDAVARSDTGALRDMHISPAEYAFLYFPASKMMRPPYELPPEVAWLLESAESSKGITSILRRFGGQRLELRGMECPGEALREGPNVVWRDCVVTYHDASGTQQRQPLFAAIIERDGRFKFFSYATSL